MIDSAQPSRFAEAKEELGKVVLSHELEKTPILVLANKTGALFSSDCLYLMTTDTNSNNRQRRSSLGTRDNWYPYPMCT